MGTQLVNAQQTELPITVQFGKDDLNCSVVRQATPEIIRFDPNSARAEVKTRLGRWPCAHLNPGSQVRVEVLSRSGKSRAVFETPEMRLSETDYPMYAVNSEKRLVVTKPTLCDITITFADRLGSRVTWQWAGITVVAPGSLVDKPWFRSIIAFTLLCLLAYTGSGLRGGFQRWAPLGVYLVGGGAGLYVGARPDFLNGFLLVTLQAAAAVLMAIMGAVSPVIFRELEPLEPFRSIAPWALSIPWVRRRLYAAYVKKLSDNVELAKEKQNKEVYCPIPIREIESRGAAIRGGSAPAQQLLERLAPLKEKERAHVLIESPGGRGKSALVRETIALAINEFRKDPRCPLPIVCNGEGEDLFSRAMLSIGTQGFSQELFRKLMRSQEFFLVIDDLTESSVTPHMLQEHVARFGLGCPLLLAGRPNKSYRQTIEATSAWLIVEPLRLDEASLTLFIQAYGAKEVDFTGSLKNACRSADGEYLPILVRLALMVVAENPKSVSEIYRSAVSRLLNKQDSLIDDTVQLCEETYWKDGERRLEYATVAGKRKEILETLVESALLIPADLGLIQSEEPRTVRFFHDSIQSYLTAVALARKENRMDLLLRAAGADEFVRDRSDLFTDIGSELFQMCLHVFEPESSVRRAMRQQLLQFAERFGGAFSRDWVVEVSNLPNLKNFVGPDISGRRALELAVEECAGMPDLRWIGALYERVVRFLWQRGTLA